MTLHLESGELSSAFLLVSLSGATHGWRAVGSWKLIREHALLAEVLVVIRTAHVRILSNALFASFPAHKRAAHGAGYHAGCHDEDRSRKHDPAAPFYMRHKEQDVDQESQKSDE